MTCYSVRVTMQRTLLLSDLYDGPGSRNHEFTKLNATGIYLIYFAKAAGEFPIQFSQFPPAWECFKECLFRSAWA